MISNGEQLRADLATAQEILTDFLGGCITAEGALSRWPRLDRRSHRLLKRAWHLLEHYVDDADIRHREPGYERAQKEQLRTCLKAIEMELKTQTA